MKMNAKDLCLYIVTDRGWLGNQTLETQVEAALAGGATFLQIREKDMDKETFINEALSLKKLAAEYNVPFVVNDAVDIALAVDADGVHIGQEDGNVAEVRKQISKEKILGVSVGTVEEALSAQGDGADYLGVGAIYATPTKDDAQEVGADGLKAICEAVDIPVVAIGGLNRDNFSVLKNTGASGAALISAIFNNDDITRNTREIKEIIEEVVNAHD